MHGALAFGRRRPSDRCRKASSGFWAPVVGRGGGGLQHILIVESLQPDGSASVIYGWGDSPGLSITHGFIRLGANLSDTLTIQSSFSATYKLTSAISATASYRRGEGRSQADMVKVDLAALIASGKKFGESHDSGITMEPAASANRGSALGAS
jgi:hypothetical protein